MPKQRVERTRGGGRYTESGFWGFIRAGLRAKYSRWGPRYDVLAAAKRPYKGPNARQKHAYECSQCKQLFAQKEVEVDHIIECGSLRGFDDLVGFVKRLFCEADGLRVVCKPCHLQITAATRAARGENSDDDSGSA